MHNLKNLLHFIKTFFYFFMSSIIEKTPFRRFFQPSLSIENKKNETLEFLKKSVLKIQNFIATISPIVFFILCSIYVLNFAPTRFLFSVGITLFSKIKSEPNKNIITTTHQALNIIGTIGVFLEKASCPACDPSFYLAAYISGYAFGASSYNLIRRYL